VPSSGIWAGIAIEEVPAAGLTDAAACGPWRSASVALEPARLRLAGSGRWGVSFLVARMDAAVVAVLPLFRHRGASFASAVFDPASVAPGLFGDRPANADRYLFIGGGPELVAGAATAAGLARPVADRITAALAGAAFATAARRELTGVSLYVRDSELGAFAGPETGLEGGPETGPQGPRGVAAVGEFTALHLPEGGMDGYLASLNHGRRSVVRRDLARIAQAGLTAAEAPPADLIEEAAELVTAVKARHGQPGHPMLTSLRLTEWSRAPGGVPVAFGVRDRAGRLIAASFGTHRTEDTHCTEDTRRTEDTHCTETGVLELYEVGLADDPAVRQLAYVEVLVYAPLRFAFLTGCRRIDLGLGSTTPKKLRGAKSSPVWAVGPDVLA
jgi:hypothetical protein